MQVVIDANIVIAMLINPSKIIDIFFNNRLEIFAPELLFEELKNNKEEIIKKSKLKEEWFDLFYTILKNNIIIIPEEEFLNYREKAEAICPDPKDIVYFALALYLKCSIWTNEKKLRNQEGIKIFATKDLIDLFNIF